MELEKFTEWLLLTYGIDISKEMREYTKTYDKNSVLLYLANLHGISYFSLFTHSKHNIGNKRIAIARGHLVKVLLLNKSFKFKSITVYQDVFGIKRDHSTALHYKQMEFIGEELKIYKQLENFILNNTIIWT